MNNTFDNLKNKWKDAKKAAPSRLKNASDLLAISKQKMKSAVNMHIKNIAVLAITLIVLIAFFIYVAPFQQTQSHVGIVLMVGGLFLRILIECYSIFRSSKINLTESAALVNQQYLNFYLYRKLIHGPITIIILLAYTVGYYLLIPEFSLYFSRPMVILLIVSYLPIAAVVGYFIRKSIGDEMRFLKELIEVRKDIAD